MDVSEEEQIGAESAVPALTIGAAVSAMWVPFAASAET